MVPYLQRQTLIEKLEGYRTEHQMEDEAIVSEIQGMNKKIKARKNREAIALRSNLKKRKLFQKKIKKNK